MAINILSSLFFLAFIHPNAAIMVSVRYTKAEKDRSTHSGATSRFESFIDELFVSSQRIYCSCMQGPAGKKISSEEKILLEYIRSLDQKRDGKEPFFFFALQTSQNP